jgi:type I restriction enzyme, S subunit
MNPEWESVSVGRVLKRVERFESRNDFKEYPFAGTYSFARGIFVAERKLGVSFKLPKVQRLKTGDFVYCKIMAWEGAFGTVPPKANNCVMSGAFVVYEHDESIVDRRFLDWYFRAPSNWQRIGRQSTGTNVRRQSLLPDQFEASEIRLPLLEEQQRIVARIEELASRIDEARKVHDESRKALSAFVSATHVALSKSQPEPLSSFIELSEDQVSIEADTPYPQAGVRGFGKGLFPKPPVFGGQTTYRAFNRLYKGSLVMSQVKGWEGAVAMTPEELEGYFVSPEYRTFRCKQDRCLPGYMAALVSTEFFWSRLKDATRGVGARRERTRPEQFLQLELCMPSLPDQRRAIEAFATVNAVRQLQREIIPDLDAMLPAILDKAFKGEL